MNIINADKIGDPRRFGGLFLKVLGVLLVFWAINSAVFTIDAGHIGVVTRFGAISGATAQPGLNFKFPLIERVHEFEVRIQKETAEAAAASRDLQSVSSTIAVNFHIEAKNARQLYEELGIEFKSRVIDPAVQEVFKAATAGFTAEELITRREEVKTNARNLLKSRLDDYYIIVDDVNIVNFDFSREFNVAIEAKQVAQQEVQKARQELERAKVDAERRVTEAQAQAEAQRLQQQTLTPLFVQKIWIDKWDGKLPTYMSGDAGSNAFFTLPAVPRT